MPNVGYIRRELALVLPMYQLIRDCLSGERHVKSLGVKYLPQPNPEDTSEENLLRYKSYKERAVFYNVTRRTLSGITGLVFARNVNCTVPSALEGVLEDANGEGVSILQTSKRAMQYGLGYGRAGLFIDYPTTDGIVTQMMLDNGNVKPTVSLYAPWQVVNWRTVLVGSKRVLSLVVIQEPAIIQDDGFEISEGWQWRVLKLEPLAGDTSAGDITDDLNDSEMGTTPLYYKVEFWNKGKSGKFAKGDEYFPTDSNGKLFTEIPFKFIGAENNDSEVDHPPLYDLASVNIAHYRNSADYEESCFIVGQPTPWFAGLTEDWAKDIALGARGAVALPSGGVAGLLQAAPNTMPFEAMKHKEDQMIALGAKLVEIKAGNRTTATEAMIDDASETSILVNVSRNVSDAFLWALRWCCKFVGANEDEVDFHIDSDLEINKLSSQDQMQIVANWQAGTMSLTEVRRQWRNAGLAFGNEQTALTEIQGEEQKRLDAEKQKMAANNKQTINNNKQA